MAVHTLGTMVPLEEASSLIPLPYQDRVPTAAPGPLPHCCVRSHACPPEEVCLSHCEPPLPLFPESLMQPGMLLVVTHSAPLSARSILPAPAHAQSLGQKEETSKL